jgi:hypothetical protein
VEIVKDKLRIVNIDQINRSAYNMGHSQISSILLLFVSFAYKHYEIPIETVVYAEHTYPTMRVR